MKEGQAKWFISLFGSDNEKEQLRDFLDLPNCRLVQAKKNKGYYLTSCRFSNLTDSKKVRESAEKLVTMIRAFAKIELGGDFLSVNLGSGKIVVDSENATTIIRSVDGDIDGKADVYISGITAKASISANVATVVIQDKDGNIVPQEPSERQERLHDYYLNRCDEKIDSTIFDALFYFAQVTSWYSLYKVFKTIQSKNRIRKMIEDGWVDSGKLKSFRTSAQYYDAIGGAKDAYLGSDAGRHAKVEYKEKKDASLKEGKRDRPLPTIMHLPEAENLIRHLLEKWLESKQTTA